MRTRSSIIVGREREFRAIEQALHAAGTGHGRSIVLTGEAGIGKSRLAAAAAQRGVTTGMRVLRGRSSAIGPAVPYRSLTEALLSLLRTGDPIDVRELGPYRPALGRLVPDWGPPPPDSDGSSALVLAEAVLRLLALAGQERGCLLVLDDLQDSDAETLGVVDFLIDNLAGQPVVLLGAIRAEPCAALDLATSAVQRGTGALVELDRLDRADVRRLVCSCLGSDLDQVPDAVIEQVWTDSAGNPLLAEELLNGMLTRGVVVRHGTGWQVTGRLRPSVPITLVRTVARRMDRFSSSGRELLSVAAVFGRSFPVSVVQAATGMGDGELLDTLHGEIAEQLVDPDDEMPGWYRFQHPLIVDALLALLAPAERGKLCQRAADAVDTIHPGLPGDWCQIAASLRLGAGDKAAAGRLFAEAGRRALALGSAASAVALLDKAQELLVAEDMTTRANTFAPLLDALVEAGLVGRAVASAAEFGQIAGVLDHRTRARLYTRLAWAAVVAGRSVDGLALVETARTLLGPGAGVEDTAPIDVVTAHLVLDVPGPDQVDVAESLARRAAAAAEAVPLPVVACQAWQLLGAITRRRDPDEATACLERSRALAVRHRLPIWELHALVRLGNDDALRTGNLDGLEQARREAERAGAVTAGYQSQASIALQHILRGEFHAAEVLISRVLTATTRLKLLETTQYLLVLRAVLDAHRGRRREMNAALAEFQLRNGDQVQHAPRILGLAHAWCSLLEENHARARQEQAQALAAEETNPTIFYLSGRYGLDLLLRVVAGELDGPAYRATTASPASRLRWDRQFAMFAEAVLAGRAADAAGASGAVAEALRLGEPYPMARHLGLRLVGEAALVDGWGEPVAWLRMAEEYFHAADITPVASACRALMRQVGAPVGQRRRGVQKIPPALRAIGVTVREYEVLRLLTGRLSNREIAARLHLSARTVERHVANLMTKTGQRDRIALGELAADPAYRADHSPAT